MRRDSAVMVVSREKEKDGIMLYKIVIELFFREL